jgi:uncharacterized protein (TIGR03000 family)
LFPCSQLVNGGKMPPRKDIPGNYRESAGPLRVRAGGWIASGASPAAGEAWRSPTGRTGRLEDRRLDPSVSRQDGRGYWPKMRSDTPSHVRRFGGRSSVGGVAGGRTMSARPVSAGRIVLLCLAALVVARAPSAAHAQPTALVAAVEVRLPADAELWFDGVALPRMRERREFVTPPLRPGLTYRYEVQTRWQEGGRLVVRGEHVIVRAGESVVVDFTRPRGDEGRPDHMAVREIAPPPPLARVVAVAREGRVERPAGQPAARHLPSYMTVTEFDPTLSARNTVRPYTNLPGHMSIVEFGTPRN